jgi:hypothetical protein
VLAHLQLVFVRDGGELREDQVLELISVLAVVGRGTKLILEPRVEGRIDLRQGESATALGAAATTILAAASSSSRAMSFLTPSIIFCTSCTSHKQMRGLLQMSTCRQQQHCARPTSCAAFQNAYKNTFTMISHLISMWYLCCVI